MDRALTLFIPLNSLSFYLHTIFLVSPMTISLINNDNQASRGWLSKLAAACCMAPAPLDGTAAATALPDGTHHVATARRPSTTPAATLKPLPGIRKLQQPRSSKLTSSLPASPCPASFVSKSISSHAMELGSPAYVSKTVGSSTPCVSFLTTTLDFYATLCNPNCSYSFLFSQCSRPYLMHPGRESQRTECSCRVSWAKRP